MYMAQHLLLLLITSIIYIGREVTWNWIMKVYHCSSQWNNQIFWGTNNYNIRLNINDIFLTICNRFFPSFYDFFIFLDFWTVTFFVRQYTIFFFLFPEMIGLYNYCCISLGVIQLPALFKECILYIPPWKNIFILLILPLNILHIIDNLNVILPLVTIELAISPTTLR